MHISEGVLSVPVLLGGAALTIVGTAIGLRRVGHERLMTVAVMAAAFFVGSLIHVPIGPANAHLVLNGLLGAILGPAAFPAILVALTLQAVLFQYGGLTALGVNAFNMAFPAVVCWVLFRPLFATGRTAALGGFACGFAGVLLAALLTAFSLALSDEAFGTAATVLVVGHLPVMVVEGLVTAMAVAFFAKSRPELLHTSPR